MYDVLTRFAGFRVGDTATTVESCAPGAVSCVCELCELCAAQAALMGVVFRRRGCVNEIHFFLARLPR